MASRAVLFIVIQLLAPKIVPNFNTPCLEQIISAIAKVGS